MRVLEIVADGNAGGGTTHVLQILRGLGNSCSLGLVTQVDSYLWREARSLGVPLFGTDFFRSRLDPKVPLKLRRFVQKYRPQVVHAHGGRAGFFYALAAAQVPMVYTVHGYHFLHKASLMRRLALCAERLATSSAKRMIFVSEEDAKVAHDHNLLVHPEWGTVIHNGVPFEKIPRAKPDEPGHVGFIGRLEYQKDPLLFLDVVERLPGYQATIVGAGELSAEVGAETQSRGLAGVRMLGALSQPEALEELSKFNTLCVTSRWEGLCIGALEAMACGVPVVAVDVGGFHEVIENEKSGLLVHGRSADDIARAVMRLDEDLALRARIVEEGRNRVRKLFSEERMLRKVLEVYNQVVVM